jgi:predicted ester cyclase
MLAFANIRCIRRTLCRKNKRIKPSLVVGSPASGARHAISASVDELAAPNMLLQYSLHEPRRGHADIKAFMTDFRAAFPDLSFGGAADLIAEGDCVVGRWVGGGTHSGPAFSDFLAGALPAATGRKMHFTGTTVLRLENGKIVEEIGLDDGVTALTQLGLIRAV